MDIELGLKKMKLKHNSIAT